MVHGYAAEARRTADWLVSIQDEAGGFHNFQRADGSFLPLQSGNVNFYASMALWIYNEVYEDGAVKVFTDGSNHTYSAGDSTQS